jgi:hypothetical protein
LCGCVRSDFLTDPNAEPIPTSTNGVSLTA